MIFKFGGKIDLFTPCNKIEYYSIYKGKIVFTKLLDEWTEVEYN